MGEMIRDIEESQSASSERDVNRKLTRDSAEVGYTVKRGGADLRSAPPRLLWS